MLFVRILLHLDSLQTSRVVFGVGDTRDFLPSVVSLFHPTG